MSTSAGVSSFCIRLPSYVNLNVPGSFPNFFSAAWKTLENLVSRRTRTVILVPSSVWILMLILGLTSSGYWDIATGEKGIRRRRGHSHGHRATCFGALADDRLLVVARVMLRLGVWRGEDVAVSLRGTLPAENYVVAYSYPRCPRVTTFKENSGEGAMSWWRVETQVLVGS